MCGQCSVSQTEQIRIALFKLGHAFDGDCMASSKARMDRVDRYIKRKICANWKRASIPLYVNAARTMTKYQAKVIQDYVNGMF